MSWYEEYCPRNLDDILSNTNVVGYLKKMIELNNYSHFVLSGEPGSGKRTLIKIFLNTVTNTENTLWLNHLSLKTLESKDKLNSFINSKTSEKRKWLIIENLHKMSSQFLFVLYNLLSSSSIVVCVLESNAHTDLSSWAMTFNMNMPTDSTLVDIARIIMKDKGIRFNRKLVDKCILHSNGKLCSFLFFLQVNCQKHIDLTSYSQFMFPFDLILSSESLKVRLGEVHKLELSGFSHIDIAMQLYKHVTAASEDIDTALQLGQTIEHLNNYEHDPYNLYACICKIWKLKR